TGHIATPPGSLDRTFKTGIGADDSIRCLALLPDAKMLIGGVFKHYDGSAEPRMARLQPDGALDLTFKSTLAGTVSAIVPLGGGKTIAGGEGLLAGHGGRKVLRLNPDGDVDPSFYGGSYDRNIETLAVQSDGKIIVGGHFVNVSGKRHRGLLRLTADGRLDDSFNVGAGSSWAVDSVAIQSNGEILAAGQFDRFNGRAVGRLVRLNPDGSFDAGFNDGTGADAAIWHVQLQKDGKILICGRFNHVNGLPCDHIARLDADGAVDTAFHASGVGDSLGCMALQPDGKIVVAGKTTVNGVTRPFLARLNADGSLDKSFQVTGETGNGLWQISVQPNRGILVVGRFTSLDGVLCGNIARLHE
ncbi:MAG: delta-60 repeat domain-containing protein, partial [Limisphaerales bacterium]